MTLIAITLALIIERLIGGVYLILNFAWLQRWASAIEKRLSTTVSPALAYALVVAPLLLLIAIAEHYMSAYLWGLPGFVLHVVILLACLGPRLLDQDVDDYIYARQHGDIEKLNSAVPHITGKTAPERLSAEVREVTEAVFYQANIRWYSVIFWYLLLGPVGAAAYRLTLLLRTDQCAAGGFARQFYGLLGWVPARVSALYFGFMGSLDEAWHALTTTRKNHKNWAESNRLVLSHTGCAAINMEMDAEHDEGQEMSWQVAVKWVSRARGLCLRVLMLWLATVAVFTLFGWMV